MQHVPLVLTSFLEPGRILAFYTYLTPVHLARLSTLLGRYEWVGGKRNVCDTVRKTLEHSFALVPQAISIGRSRGRSPPPEHIGRVVRMGRGEEECV